MGRQMATSHPWIKDPKMRWLFDAVDDEARRRHISPARMWDILNRQMLKNHHDKLRNSRAEVVPAKTQVRDRADRRNPG